MKNDLPERAPSWNTVILVCKACQKRSDGPKALKSKGGLRSKGDLKSKRVVAAARRGLRHLKPRPRVLLTSCLGLCPKAAVAVAMVGGGSEPRIVPLASLKQLERLLPIVES